MSIRWVIDAETELLERAARFAGLDPNAVREYPGPSGVGALAFPGPFCREAVSWMKALSYLVAKDLKFWLFLISVRPDNEAVEIGRTRIFPVLDPETLDLLRTINRTDTDELARQSDRVTAAMDRLKRLANQALMQEFADLSIGDGSG